MSLRTLLLAALLGPALVGLAAPAIAAPPSDPKIDQLLEISRAKASVEDMLPQIEASQRQLVEQIVEGQSFTDAQRQVFESVMRKASTRMTQVMSWDKLEPMYRDLYRQTFSAEDVDALIEFYKTPAGQNLLDKTPQLVQNTMTAMQKQIAPVIEEFKRDLSAELDRARTGSTEKSPAKTP